MAWCPMDSSLLLTCAKDNLTLCWDTSSGEVVSHTLHFEIPFLCVVWLAKRIKSSASSIKLLQCDANNGIDCRFCMNFRLATTGISMSNGHLERLVSYRPRHLTAIYQFITLRYEIKYEALGLAPAGGGLSAGFLFCGITSKSCFWLRCFLALNV